MIPVNPAEEPAHFNEQIRMPGLAHLQRNSSPDAYIRPYWTLCIDDLARVFSGLCGFTAQFNNDGTVDHFLDKKNHRHLAYEWDNYRFASPAVQSRKKPGREYLDPFEVEDGWFAISLPDLQLYLTDSVPEEKREIAQDTIEKLDLIKGRHVMRQRQALFSEYKSGNMNVEAVRRFAPLLARAIEAALAENRSF